MLNRFYKYLTDKLIGYFEEVKLSGGERFYLQFDNKTQVNEFYDFLKYEKISEVFHYKHEQGMPYSTFAINVDGIKVVVAATNGNVTPDFLVTLRNEVGLQGEGWKDTALLSICYETLDSIRGGSSDLQKEGMPLNVNSILKNLEEEIDKNNTLSPEHKEVLKFHLKKKKEESFIQSSLWDYSEILGFLSHGEITKREYANIGLFYDDNLQQFSKGQMRNRLEDNYTLFQQVQHIHEYENLQNQLEKLFDDRGIKLLKKEEWKENEYSDIRRSYEKSQQAVKPLEYIEPKNNLTREGLVYWERPQMETKAGQKKRHLIIFNPNKLNNIELSFEFNDRLKKEHIHKKAIYFAKVYGNKLTLNLEHTSGTTSFHHAIYTHNAQTKSKYTFNVAVVECNPSIFEEVKTLFEVNTKNQRIILNRREEVIAFGNATDNAEEVLVEDSDQILTIEDNGMIISNESPVWEDDNLDFQLETNKTNIPFTIKEVISKVTPISGIRIWKLKRENEADFTYDINTNKLKQNSREFSASNEIRSFLLDEIELIKNGYIYSERVSTSLVGKEINLNSELFDAYNKLLSYYQRNNLIPSLAYMNEELTNLSLVYIKSYINLISNIEENVIGMSTLNWTKFIGAVV